MVSGDEVAPSLSVTVSLNVNSVFAVTCSASNVDSAICVLLKVTVGPAVCSHKYEVTIPSLSVPTPLS